jgi:membrane protease YdiL (CAAX protease family)
MARSAAMEPLQEVDAARGDDAVADAIAARVGAAPVSPGRLARLLAIPLGAVVVLPGLLIGLAPAARGSWAALAMGALLVVAGAGVTISRPWGAPLATLGCASLALRSAAAGLETGGGWPLAGVAILAAAGTGALFGRRALRLRAAIAGLAPPERIRAWRRERARAGPGAGRTLVAVGAVYVVFSGMALAYHRARGIEAPIGIVVRGRDLAALAVRTSFYVLTIAAALFATRGHGAPPASFADRVREVSAGVLFFLGTFAVLSGLGSLLDLVAALRGSGVGAVASSFRQGLEAETARPERGFDVVRIAYVAVLAPLGEELLFRWALLRALRTRLPFAAAAILQAALFAVLHRYRFAAYQTLVIAFVSAWVVERTGRILPSIVGHGLWNGLQSLG